MATSKHIKYSLEDDRLSGLNVIQKEAIASEIIQKIEERTSRGIDKNGSPFTAYSKAYRESTHFRDAGKSGVVNLEFSAEMINSMVFLPEESNGNNITIGFINGSEQNSRAQYIIEGHGRKGDFTQPTRDFMGLTSPERSEVLSGLAQPSSNVFNLLSVEFLRSIF